MRQQQETPLSAFFKWERETPQRIFLRQPISGDWKEWTFHDAGQEVRKIAAGLKALNFPDGAKVGILSKNCAHWIMADLAIMMAGYVSVPIYPTQSASGIREVLAHSEASLVFVGKLDDYESQREGIDARIQKICYPFYGSGEGVKWDDLLRSHEPLKGNESPEPERLASIVYSSGTTGTPKGAMLTFGCFGYVGEQVRENFRLRQPERFFSYLPLSHIAERGLMEMVALSSGSTISFAESLETFQQNLRDTQPTIFGGVPRIFAKFRDGILEKIQQKTLDRLLTLPGVNILVRRMLLKKLGLLKARVVVCGAAPTPVPLLTWFNKLGLEIREAYGMTENTAYSHCNFRLVRNGTVGQPWPGVDVQLDPHGEVLIRHAALMTGYFKDPTTTKKVFTENGFLKTGDIGAVDPQGFLTITGRVKDQFKTEKAKFVAPSPIEMKLAANASIDQVCVVGSGLPQPMALITLSSAGLAKPQELIEVEITETIEHVNMTLEKHEHIRTAVIVQESWNIENGFITPSMKIKRNVVEKHYQNRYAEWFNAGAPVVWDSRQNITAATPVS